MREVGEVAEMNAREVRELEEHVEGLKGELERVRQEGEGREGEVAELRERVDGLRRELEEREEEARRLRGELAEVSRFLVTSLQWLMGVLLLLNLLSCTHVSSPTLLLSCCLYPLPVACLTGSGSTHEVHCTPAFSPDGSRDRRGEGGGPEECSMTHC